MSQPRKKNPFTGHTESQRQTPTTIEDSQRAPRLPASVQANLLSVGMRVRKAVPEGYKTRGHNAFKLWTDTKPLRCAAPAELLPFCGINKVGGLGCQDEPDEECVPELTLSQESVESDDLPEGSKRKRSFVEEDGEDEHGVLVPLKKGWDEQVSPRTVAPSKWVGSRTMAVPKTRAKGRNPPRKGIHQGYVPMADDFEEADFLVMGQMGLSPDMDLG